MNQKKLYIFLSALSLVGYAWLAWKVAEGSGHSTIPATCLFKEITGIPCPSCGTTRSLMLLVNGHFLQSLMMNPLGAILAIALLIVPFWIALDTFRKRDSFFRSYGVAERYLTMNKWVSVPATAALVLNWIWNISKGI